MNWRDTVIQGNENNDNSRKYHYLVELPLDVIGTNKIALRSEVEQDSEEFKMLQKSISEQGIRSPIQVIPNKDDPFKFTIVDGFHRFTAATNLKLATIPVNVTPNLTDNDIYVEQFTANNNRVATKPAQFGRHLKRYLARNPDCTQAELANVFQTSQARVSQLLKIASELHEQVQELVDKGEITAANALALAKLPEDRQLEFIEDARTMNFDNFGQHMALEADKIRKARRNASDSETGDQFTPVARPRKKNELLDYHNMINGEAQANQSITPDYLEESYRNMDTNADVKAGIILGIRYALGLDPQSIKEQEAEAQERAQAKALKQAEKDREKIAANAAKGTAASKILGV